MIVTCGAFVIDKDQRILLCRATNSLHGWGVPKGWPHPNEMPHLAAKRELFEETGINIDFYPYKMCELGISPYTHKNKVIVGFAFEVDAIIDQILFCDSYFTDILTQTRKPEVDMYEWLSVKKALCIMGHEQAKLLKYYLKIKERV